MRVICKVILLASLLAAVWGCAQPSESDPVTSVAEGDVAMNAAMAKAKATRPEFLALYKKNVGRENALFYVKTPFDTRTGNREHIWIFVEEIKADTVYGIVANEPSDVPALKYKDKVQVDLKDTSDWRVQIGDKVYGDYTKKALDSR